MLVLPSHSVLPTDLSWSIGALALSSRHFLSLLACLRKTDGNRLLAVFDLATSPATSALRPAAFIAVHFILHFFTGTARVTALSFLRHQKLLDAAGTGERSQRLVSMRKQKQPVKVSGWKIYRPRRLSLVSLFDEDDLDELALCGAGASEVTKDHR